MYLQYDPKSLRGKMFPKCSKILKYNAVFNVKVANGQGLRRMEVLAGEKAYKCVY